MERQQIVATRKVLPGTAFCLKLQGPKINGVNGGQKGL